MVESFFGTLLSANPYFRHGAFFTVKKIPHMPREHMWQKRKAVAEKKQLLLLFGHKAYALGVGLTF